MAFFKEYRDLAHPERRTIVVGFSWTLRNLRESGFAAIPTYLRSLVDSPRVTGHLGTGTHLSG